MSWNLNLHIYRWRMPDSKDSKQRYLVVISYNYLVNYKLVGLSYSFGIVHVGLQFSLAAPAAAAAATTSRLLKKAHSLQKRNQMFGLDVKLQCQYLSSKWVTLFFSFPLCFCTKRTRKIVAMDGTCLAKNVIFQSFRSFSKPYLSLTCCCLLLLLCLLSLP